MTSGWTRQVRLLRRRQGLWLLLLGGICLFMLGQLLGLTPSVLTGLAPGLEQDVAMLVGLLVGTTLAALLLGRMPSTADTGFRDPRTGLFLQRYADEAASTLAARDARSGGSRLTLVVIVLAESERIVRQHGIEPLESLLVMVAETLRSQCRGADLPFRLSARELAVYLHCDGLEQADAFGRRINMLLSSQQLDWHGEVLKPIVHMGRAAHKPGLTLDSLRAAARERLPGR